MWTQRPRKLNCLTSLLSNDQRAEDKEMLVNLITKKIIENDLTHTKICKLLNNKHPTRSPKMVIKTKNKIIMHNEYNMVFICSV